MLTYDDEDETASLDGVDSTTGISTQTRSQMVGRHDKQKMEELKKLQKQLTDDIKSIDDGG